MDGGNRPSQDVRVADASWQQWPDVLRTAAQRVLSHCRAGRPGEAVADLDELIADLTERRAILADSANRVFEPSTDDRNL